MAERLRGSDGKFIRKSELLGKWQEDGFEPSHTPSTLLSRMIDIVNSVNGEYGADHIAALANVNELILKYEHETRPLYPAEKAELIVLATRDIVGRTNRTEEADQAYRYMRHEIIPGVLGAHFFTRASRELGRALANQSIRKSDIHGDRKDEFYALNEVSPIVASQVIRRFNELELTAFSDETDDQEITLGANKKAAQYLTEGAVETARLISKILNKETPREIETVDQIVEIYDRHNETRRINTVTVETNTDNLRVLPINELRLGHQDQGEGVKLIIRTAELIKNMPEKEKPQVILLTNLIQSDYAHHQAKKRATLARRLETDHAQYNAAHVIIDKLRELNIPIIVSLGPDDHEMAADYALDTLKEMRGIEKQAGKENLITYYETNRLIQDSLYQDHKRFYIENIIPLCYRMGRRLRSAAEVAKATGGELNKNEYIILYDHIMHGEELPVELGIDPEVIAELGEWRNNICFVDDFNLRGVTKEDVKDVAYRHNVAFSAETLAVNHMMPMAKLLGSLATNQYDLPDLAMTGRAQEAFYLTGMVALPGMWDTAQSLNSRQYYATAPGDASRRSNFNRRVPGVPTIDMIEMTDDGRFRQHFISKELLDKADSLPRTAVFEFCDTQIGSVSARQDYQVMYLSYMLEVAQEMPIAIQFAGDIVHGFLYNTMIEESQRAALLAIKSQKLAVSAMMKKHFDTSDPVVATLVDRVIDVIVQPGNHDKIMRPKLPGNNDDNVDYLIRDAIDIFDKPGEPTKVRHDAIKYVEGTPVPTWMGTTHLGAYTIRMAHYHMERGMRGGGGFPVEDAYRRAQGIGREEDADWYMGAHWHNPQILVRGKKLITISGPMASQTEFEDMRGMRARVAGIVGYIGGKQPLTIEFISAETLWKHGVKFGGFTPDKLADQGFHDDPDFDFMKHGPYSQTGAPKSALIKAILHENHRASEYAMYTAEMENPNTYDEHGDPMTLNDLTRRAFEIAAKQNQ